MSKKNKENITVEEPVVIENEAILTDEEVEELKDEEVVEVEATEVIVEEPVVDDEPESYKLEIVIAFTDKYTGEKYPVGKVITVSKERYQELINDKRGLAKEGE